MGTPDMFSNPAIKACLCGDVVHFPHIQIQRPDVSIAFDHDASLAAATRSRLLDQVSADGLLIAGMHLGNSGSHVSSG